MAQNTNTKTTATEAKAEAVKQLRICKCGCGQPVAGKSAYRQGHDARHVSNLVEIVKIETKDMDDEQWGLMVANLATKLASGKLQTKFVNAASRWMYKQFDKDIAAAKKNDAHVWTVSFHPDDVRIALEGMENTQLGDRSAVSRNDVPKSDAEIIAEEEAQYAEENKAPEPMFDDDEITEVKVGRWTYPARNGGTERNTKRDGSGEWIPVAK